MPEGNLKFKFLPEREIQVFSETDLVAKIARGVGCVDSTTNFTEDSD